MDHDSLYHRLVSHPLMTEQLIRDFLPDAMAAGLSMVLYNASPGGQPNGCWR